MFRIFSQRLLSSPKRLFLVNKQKCVISPSLRFLAKKIRGKIDVIPNKLELEAAEQHALLMQQYHLQVLDSQQVLVIQPYYEATSPNSRQFTTDDMMMAETLGLVKTLG